MSGWNAISAVTTPRTTMLNKLVTVTQSFSDGRPNLVHATPSNTSQAWSQFVGTYQRFTYEGNGGVIDGNAEKEEMMYLNQYGVVTDTTNTDVVVDTVDGGTVTRTTTTVTDDQVFTLTRKYRVDERINYSKIWSPAQIFIYRIGTGNSVLDSLTYNYSGDNGYFPFIPLRLDNKFISPSYLPAT